MSGRRGKNLREGDRAEGLGIELLRSFAAVAPVPRTEDVGIDAVCTLLKPSGSFLLADESFLVQIKAASVRMVEYHDDSYEWLLRQMLPIYLASIQLSTSEIELFAMQRAVDRIEDAFRGVTAYLDSRGYDDGDDYDHGPDVRDNVHHVCLGPPILRWSIADSGSARFRDTALTVMQSWVAWDHGNLRLRPYRCVSIPRWTTNCVPTLSHSRYGPKIDTKLIRDFAQCFGASMIALSRDCELDEARLVLSFIGFLGKKGIQSMEIQVAESQFRFDVENGLTSFEHTRRLGEAMQRMGLMEPDGKAVSEKDYTGKV